MPSCDPLPSKESSLFKRILKSYEKKQYKNGLKFAKQILSNQRFADHGETLAMKGLILNCLGKKEEAYECVKRGLKYDLKSHVCWHAYGLLQRSDHKYEEAIKCYRNALKLDKDNGQILRDLSFLQIQMRDLEGYRDTRYHLFLLRPTQRVTWIGYAMAYHLLKEFDMCLKILNSFKKTLFPTDYDYYEFSEFLLYQNLVIQESGNFEEALKHLQEHKDHICDKIVYKENLVNIYIQLGFFKEAEIQIRSLINDNPNNASYFNMLSVVLHSDTDHQYLSLLYELSVSYPKASMPQQLILKYTYGKEFSSKIDEYLINGLRKGKPSLFISICSLYSDKEKVKIIEELVESYLYNLKTSGHFHKSELIENEETTATLLWVYYFLSQHYDILGNSEQALYHINNALDHTPTLIDLYVMKAKVYKHAGDLIEACNWMDEAQELDTADRFLNSKCTKYLLRADLIDEAEEMSSKFTRNGSVMENLNEMQCLWFQTECALAYQRLGNLGEALKKCCEVERHFLEITEDQFDFHSYCMRKMTLRSYVGLLRLEDVLRSHSFYRKVAKCAIEVYISLHDEPLIDKKIYDKKATPHILNDDLSPSELKKIKSKQRKAQKKAELQAEINAALERKDSMKRSKPKPYDPDCDYLHHEELDPEKLTKISDPLNQAVKFLLPLQKLCSDQVETHILAYEIYSRKLKPLLMLQSVKRAYSVNSENPHVHSILIHFSQQMLEWETKGSFDINVSVVIKAQMEPILNGNLPEDINANFISNHNESVLDILEGARMIYKIDNSKQKEALEFLLTINPSKKDFTINSCTKVLFFLRNGDFGHCVEAIESFRSMFHSKFPLATAFFGSEC